MDVRTGGRAARVALAALSIALCLPAAASASTGSVAAGVLTYSGGSTADQLMLTYSGDAYVIEETTATSLSAGAGCTLSRGKLHCPASGITSFAVDLGMGSDRFTNFTLLGGAVDAGGDDDQVYGSVGSETIRGGDGADTLNGGWGNDTFLADQGADAVDGSLGTDSISYADRTGGVTATIGAGADDGEAGEGDDLRSMERVTGGAGNDALTGDADAEHLDGGAGNDTLAGAGGADTLVGGPGADGIDGGAGADALLTADGEADTGTCGTELDTFVSDAADVLDASCEGWTSGVTVGSGGKPDVVEITPGGGTGGGTAGTGGGLTGVFDAPLGISFSAAPAPFHVARGTVSVTLSCTAEATAGCTGKITLVLPRRGARRELAAARRRKAPARRRKTVIGSRRFKVAAGKGVKVPVRLSRRGRRALGLRRRTKVQALITVNTPAGKKTETRTMVVERRVARKPKKRSRKSNRRRR